MRTLLTVMTLAVSAAVLSADIKFTSTYKSMNAGTVSFARTGRK